MDELGGALRRVFNARDRNPSPTIAVQRRHSANHDGLYYVFEVAGMRIKLCSSPFGADDPEHGDYPYSVFFGHCHVSGEDQDVLRRQIARTLEKAGFEVLLEE